MMDPATAVGLAAAIGQFIAYGYNVVVRLQEYHTSMGEVPKAFRDITVVLPMLLSALKMIEEQARSGNVDTAAAEAMVTAVINGCRTQIESLQQIMDKLLPKGEDTAYRKGKKALSSIYQQKEVARIEQKLRDYIQILTLHQAAGTTSLPILSDKRRPVFNVPFDRDEGFVGRVSILAQIKTQLQAQRRVALSGVGGVGKSQLAIEACYRFQEEYTDGHIFWIYSGSTARLIKSYQEAAKALCLPGCDDPKVDIVGLVNEYLGSAESGPWLVVFDNVDNLAALSMKLESSTTSSAKNPAKIISLPRNDRGSIILTTRDTRVGTTVLGSNSTISVPPMSMEEAGDLLISQIGHIDVWDPGDMDALFDTLGFLPLAISQAAAFIEQNNITIKDYLEALMSDSANIQDLLEEDLGDIRRDRESVNSVLKTWRLSFDQIRTQKPRAAEMLSLMSMLDRQAIPKNLLVEKSDRPIEIMTSLATLQAFSLISIGTESTYQLHRLVQLATRTWVQVHAAAEEWQGRAISVVSQAFPSGKYETWPVCEKLLPHALVVCQYVPVDRTRQLQLAQLFRARSEFDERQGRFNQAELHAMKARQIRENILGTQHKESLDSTEQLACVYMMQGRYNEAAELQSYVQDMKTKTLGQENESTLWSMQLSAFMLRLNGQLDEAEKLMVLATSSAEKSLGEEDAITLAIKNELALILCAQGRRTEAEEMQLRVLEAQKKVLGEEHPSTIATIEALAFRYRMQERYNEAEILQRQVVETSERILGEKHPETLSATNLLALILHYQERFPEAENLRFRVVETRKKILGEKHPHTLEATACLAETYACQGRFAEAVNLQLQVVETRKKVQGEKHPDTLYATALLAETYALQGRFVEAVNLQLQVVGKRKEVQGPKHPATLYATALLAETYARQGLFAEAVNLQLQVVETRKQVLGEQDPTTLVSMKQLAMLREKSQALTHKITEWDGPG